MILPSSSAPPMKMPNWYYEKRQLKNTPSIRDGLDFDTEQRYRKEGARFIMECGTKMGLGHNTMATGVVYFHRFYVFQSFKSFPRYVTACCCLFLAGKVEETPKKCRDIIKMARSMLSDQKFQSFGEDTKEEVMTLERILLQTIKFDLQVEHPYSFLVKYAKCLKGDQVKLQKMVQMAWNFVNDSLSTTVCLQWEPEIIAVALIHLASKLSKFSVTKWDGQMPTHLRWWDMFVADVTMEILEDICHQVLDLYQQPNQLGVDSPPQLPPSKSSPPAKRAKISPVYAKSSPSASVVTGGSAITTVQTVGVHQQSLQTQPANHHASSLGVGGGASGHHHSHVSHQQQQQQQPVMQSHHKASIDEKLQNMPMQRNTAGPAMAYGAHAYGSSTAYGTMFQHAQFGPQPPLPQQQQQQQQQSGMFAGNQQSTHAYGPPQQIPTHYQSGSSGGGSSGSSGAQMQSQSYYQQPPPGRGGGYGGGYQGPA